MKLKPAVFATFLVIVSYIAFSFVFGTFFAPQLSTKAALLSLNATQEEYRAATTYLNPSWINGMVTTAIFIVLIGIWLSVIFRNYKRKNGSFFMVLLLAGMGTMMTSCKPNDEIVEVQNNQTVFVIPLTGDASKQVASNGIEFYESNKVNGGIVVIHKLWQQTGDLVGQGKYISDVRVIVVDRTPVTGYFTADPNVEADESKQAICAESQGSQGICAGVVMSAQVEEGDAAKFLYFYPAPEGIVDEAGKNDWLEIIVAKQVRPYIVGRFTEQMKLRTLGNAFLEANEVFEKIYTDTLAYFKPRGITINFVENNGGLDYNNPAIQQAIDDQEIAAQSKPLLLATQAASKLNNEILLERAEAEAKATVIAGEAAATVLKQNQEALSQNQEALAYQTQKLWSEAWNGQLPTWMASGGLPFLMMATPPPGPEATPNPTQ